MYSLLLLPLSTVQPLLSHLLDLLEQLNDFNRLLPETELLEEQELGIEPQKTCLGQWILTYLINKKKRWHIFKDSSWKNDVGSSLQIKVKETNAWGNRRSASGHGCWT